VKQPKFKFLNNKKLIHNLYKESFGYYNYEKNTVFINLVFHQDNHNHNHNDEDDFILNVSKSIGHEYLHYVIWKCRKQYGDRLRHQFFEEKLITELMDEDWDEEEYYYLIQEE